tara:strand:+ start:1242 stop:1415 length:174 start_codon:yes stop_codon:yes gene_type:complete
METHRAEQNHNALKRIETKIENLRLEFKATGHPRKHDMDEILSLVDVVKRNMRGKQI